MDGNVGPDVGKPWFCSLGNDLETDLQMLNFMAFFTGVARLTVVNGLTMD